MIKKIRSIDIKDVLTGILLVAAFLFILRIRDDLMLKAQSDYKISSLSLSNDTYSDAQWYIKNPGFFIDYSSPNKKRVPAVTGIDLNVLDAWNSMEKSHSKKREVIIAVIDTGIDYAHPDLAQSMWINQGEIDGDGIDNDNNGYVDDVYGWDFYNDDPSICHYDDNGKRKLRDNDNHGTHIAGIIAAAANNNTGIAGIASNIDVKIMSLKINGGTDGSGRLSNSVKAVKYAARMGADICNLSWGTDVYSKELYDTMKESDMLFVAAAGNTGSNNDEEPIYPANFKLSNLISVTSVDSMGYLNRFSNYGADTVDLAAPGNRIYSTVVGGYASMSGSSMAAPQVSSVAALLYAQSDHIYASNVKQIIIDTIKPMPELIKYMRYAGIPDAYQTVIASKQLKKDTQPPKLTLKTLYQGKKMAIPVKVRDMGTSKIRVVKWLYGERSLSDFSHGISGIAVENNEVKALISGMYTFYASDYAGNETVRTYKVNADTTAPSLRVITNKNDMSKIITINTSDRQSGIRKIKYLPGIKSREDFMKPDSGTELINRKGKVTIKVNKAGYYTVYVADHGGNAAIKTIFVKEINKPQKKLRKP